jgi:hypothetical protein
MSNRTIYVVVAVVVVLAIVGYTSGWFGSPAPEATAPAAPSAPAPATTQ